MAIQQGRYAANRIDADLRGSPATEPFRYDDHGTMATIGRAAAVALVGDRQFCGFFAWLLFKQPRFPAAKADLTLMEQLIHATLLAAESPASDASSVTVDILALTLALILVAVNGFFVAAEFALVKVRGSQVHEMAHEGRPFAKTAQWLVERLDGSLSACQLGITMASLGLGWVGEPAFAHLIEPVCRAVGITSETAVHTIAFVVAFTAITGLHLVIGEQAPKIFAIRRSEQMVLWCALPMKLFYILSYPLLISLNWSTSFILRQFGIQGAGGHSTPHSEDEIRALIREAHIHGDVTRHEHHLLDAVFEFDDIICRKVMVPRVDVEWLDASDSLEDNLATARRSRHTRLPLCEGSLDKVVGVVHIKDLLGLSGSESIDLRSLRRPPKQVPETIPISRLLRHFQATRQHLAFVVDEYGMVSGIVTLENVLEQIVGSVEDEFDMETPDIVPDGPGQYIVQGSTAIEKLQRALNLAIDEADVDTFSGYLMSRAGEILESGDRIEFAGAVAEILEVRHARAERVRVTLPGEPTTDPEVAEDISPQ